MNDYTVTEYASETNLTDMDYSTTFIVGEKCIYASISSMEKGVLSVYCIDEKNNISKFIFKEDNYCNVIGELDNRLFYYDQEGSMYYRVLTNPDEKKIFEGESYTGGGAEHDKLD